MKKALAFLLILAIIASLLAGCSNIKEEETKVQVAESITTEEKEEPKTQTTEFQKETMDEKEAENIKKAAHHINEAREFRVDFLYLGCDENERLPKEKSPYPDVANYVLSKTYSSIDEFKKEALKYYSSKTAYDNFFIYTENPEEYKLDGGPYMVEVDGKLYADTARFGGGAYSVFDQNSIKVMEISGDNAVIKVHYYNVMEPGTDKTKSIRMIKENGNWVFDELIM